MASLRNLPLVQRWECRSCTDCCRIEAVVTNDERQRIEALDLANDSEIAPGPRFTSAGRGTGQWKLNHRPDGSCVFLTATSRCRLQERFGPEAKPFVCRLFPFVLIPTGNQWRVGLRFSCPSAAANLGPPVPEKELVTLSRLLEKHVGRTPDSAPPPVVEGAPGLEWPDVARIVDVLAAVVEDRSERLERRVRRWLAIARVCRQTGLDEVRGKALTDFLQSLRGAVDVPASPADVPRPDRLLGRLLFRTLLAIYARRDRRDQETFGLWSRLGRVRAGWRFVRGRGAVPRINPFLPEVTFAEVEDRPAPPPELDETLERYYLVKLTSLQFCGPPNFGLAFWEGLESLALTLPMILWLCRAFTTLSPAEALPRALEIVDDHFGGDRMLDLPHFRSMRCTLVERGELGKLVAWYSR